LTFTYPSHTTKGCVPLSSDVNVIKADGFYLLHNTLYQTAISVSDEEAAFIDSISDYHSFEPDMKSNFHKALIEQGMLVEENVREHQLVGYYEKNSRPIYLKLILIVTRQCNFRCPYCYEEHECKTMRDETYDAIIVFIKKQLEMKKYDGLHISFFGGEPTLEHNAIVKFSKKLLTTLSEKVPYSASMTTNGYLLTPDRFRELVDCKITSYQITVDGTEDNHNKTRVVANGRGSWSRIIENLKAARDSELDFAVSIRTNFTPESASLADDFYSYISEEFGGDNRFSVHYECAKNLGGERVHKMGLCEDQGEQIVLLAKIARKYSLQDKATIDMISSFGGLSCYAGTDNSLVIDFDGTLRKCTVSIDSDRNIVGKLYESGNYQLYPSNFSNWTCYRLQDECLHCEILPLCLGKKCPQSYYNLHSCNEIKKIYQAHIVRKFE